MTSAPLTPLPTRLMRSPSKAALSCSIEVDLRALAQLVGGFLLQLALHVLQLGLQLLLVLKGFGTFGEHGSILLALQVLGLAQQALLHLGHALLDRRLLGFLQRRHLLLDVDPCQLRLRQARLDFGELGQRSLLGLRLDGLPLGGDALVGGRIRLGLGLLEGGRLLLAEPRLDLAGDVLGDRLIAGGAAVAGGVRVRLDLLAARRLRTGSWLPTLRKFADRLTNPLHSASRPEHSYSLCSIYVL